MSEALVPCVGCARHVRASESACPFCHAPFVTAALPEIPSTRGLSRAAMLLGATLSLTACPRREREVAAVYGAPPPPTLRDASLGDAARRNPNAPPRPPQDDGNQADIYGAPPPPPDAGR